MGACWLATGQLTPAGHTAAHMRVGLLGPVLVHQPLPFLSLLVTQSLRSAALEDCALCQETLSSSELAAKTRDGDLEGVCRVCAVCWAGGKDPIWTVPSLSWMQNS